LVVDLADSSTASAINEVENLWVGWTEMSVSPLMAEASVDRGLRVEEFAQVEGLVEVVRT
jgi:phosphomevalonate kinase